MVKHFETVTVKPNLGDRPGSFWALCPYCDGIIDFINGEELNDDCEGHYFDRDGDFVTFISDLLRDIRQQLENGRRGLFQVLWGPDHVIYAVGASFKTPKFFRAVHINPKENKPEFEEFCCVEEAARWCIEDILKSEGWKP